MRYQQIFLDEHPWRQRRRRPVAGMIGQSCEWRLSQSWVATKTEFGGRMAPDRYRENATRPERLWGPITPARPSRAAVTSDAPLIDIGMGDRTRTDQIALAFLPARGYIVAPQDARGEWRPVGDLTPMPCKAARHRLKN